MAYQGEPWNDSHTTTVTVTAVLTPGDGGGDDSASRTFTCVKGVCDATAPSPS